MKKVNMLKKLLSFGLAVALFVTSPASVYALDAEGTSVESMADENVEEEKVATPEPISGEEKSDSDIQLEDEGKSVPSEDPADDELNTDSPRAGIADEDFVKEDEATQDDAEKAEEEAACEHSEFRYESNGEGTHKKICKDCDEVVAENEPCEFDENGKCVLCGYEDPEHKFTLTDENGIVKVTGTKAVLNGATRVVATEITVENNEAEFEKISDALDEQVEKESKSVVDFVAYDVTLYDNDKKVDIQGNVDVVFTQLEVEGLDDSSNKAEIYHYDEEKASVDESMSASTVSADTVQMSTTHFSTYIVAVKGTQSQQLFESNYVNVSSDKAWNKITSIPGVNEKTSGIGIFGSNHQYFYWGNSTNNRYFYPLEIRVYLDDNTWEPVESIVTDNGKGFPYYATSNIGNDTFTISGKKGYSVKEVKIGASDNGYYSATKASVTGNDSRYNVPLIDYLEEGYYWGFYYKANINYLDIYLETSEPETYNVKVDLFDYESYGDIQGYWNTKKGINYMSSLNAESKGLITECAPWDREKYGAPNLLFSYSGGITKDNPLAINHSDSASVYNTDATKEIARDTLSSKRNGEISFPNRGMDNLFKANSIDSMISENRSVDNDPTGAAYKYGYYDVSFPFKATDDGYLEFNSHKQKAEFVEEDNKVKVEDVPSSQNPGFWPFDNSNATEHNQGHNPHFGMHITQYFSVPTSGKTEEGNNYTFEFSGDDDVWVYIDGQLVLDIGGIHGDVSGKIDFYNGISYVNGQKYKTGLNYRDGKSHEIQFYYLERGGNQSQCSIKFNYEVIDEPEPEPEHYTKSITVKKTWVSDNAADRPASVTFDVYGSYTEGGKTVYVTKEGNVTPTSEEDKPAYNQITIQNPNTDTNVWTGTVDGYPVFLDDDTDKVITWRLKERPVSGYKTEYDEKNIGYSTNINIPSDIKFDPVQNEGNPRYTHIDVELWTAEVNGQGGERLAGIQNFNGVEDRVTIAGYRDNSGWHSGEFDDVVMDYDDTTDEFSSRKKTQTFASLSNTSTIAFRVKFKGETDYKLVVLDNTKTYPANTVLNNPGGNGEENYRRICDFVYETNAYTQTTNGGRYYRYNAPDSVNIGGKNVYALSYASCGGNPSKGIDLVLTPETINEFSEKEYTGNETHPFINTKSSVKLTIGKYAVDGKNQSDPSNGAKYQFEIKKVNGEKLESVSADGVSNDTFTLGGRDKIDLNVSTGIYKITEKAVIYDDNSTVPKKDRLTLKSFNTRVVVNEDSETPIKSGVMSCTTEVREYTVEVNDNTTVKFENLLHKEEKTDIEATNRKYAMKNPDGTYDLTLEFTAPGVQVSSYDTVATDTEQTAGKYDVVVVLDTSSSVGGNLGTAKNAVNDMVESTKDSKASIRWKLVTFDTVGRIKTRDWYYKPVEGTTTQYTLDAFKNVVSGVNDAGYGTNYEDALLQATSAFSNARSDAKKVVVFITDGAPNCDKNGHHGNGGDPSAEGYNAAIKTAKTFNCDYFYALGVNLGTNSYTLGNERLTAKQILENFVSEIKASTKDVLTKDKFSEVAEALTVFTQGFLTNYSVANEVNTTTYATNAVITDELTKYVDFAETNNRYTVKVMNGQTPVTNITSDVNNDGKTVTAIFTAPENADLSNYTYSVTFKIKATDDAYDYLLENQSYPVENNDVTKGGPETGTHEGQEGFFSNVSADVVFTLPGEETKTLIYNKPVIQIAKIFGWEIVKSSASNPNAMLKGAEFLLKGTVNNQTVEITGTSDDNGIVVWNTDSIPEGTYTLTETKAPEGYAKTEQTWEVTVSRLEKLAVTSDGPVEKAETNSNLKNGVPMTVTKLTIKNTVAYTLPETGGRGVYVYTIGGVLLMLGACLLLYKNKKNKNK